MRRRRHRCAARLRTSVAGPRRAWRRLLGTGPLLCALLAVQPAQAFAQGPGAAAEPPPALPEDLPAYETVVTAEPGAPRARERRIRRTELDARGDRTAAEALERLPGLNASTGARGERTFTLRGLDQRQSTVLFDGAPLQLPYDGQMDLGMLPAEALEEVQVFRGPAAGLGPSTGLGGAVSIRSRRPGAAPALALRLEGGLPQALRLSATHGHRAGPAAWTVFGGFDQREGFQLPSAYVPSGVQPAGRRLNSDRQGFVGGGAVELAPNERQTWRLSATHLEAERGVPPAVEGEEPRYWRFTDWSATLASLEHRWRADWELTQTVYARRFDNLLDGYDDANYSTQRSARALHSWHHDQVAGLILQGTRAFGEGDGRTDLRARADAQYDEHQEDDARKVRRVLVGAVAEGERTLGRGLHLVLATPLQAELPASMPPEGARAFVAFDPLLALRLDARESTSLELSAARRHRLPTLKERFSGTLLEGNPKLAPESAWHVELDAAWRASPSLSLEASLFDAEVSDLIERSRGADGLYTVGNVGTARLAGLEVGGKLRLGRMLRSEASYAFLHARRGDGGPLQYRPTHKATATALLLPTRKVQLGATCRFVGPQRFLNLGVGKDAWGTLGGYTLVEASVDVEPLPDLHLYLRATNLLDALHQTEFGFPEPGRQLWAGVRFAYL